MLALLRDMITIAKSFDSVIHLHAYVFLAQKLGVIPGNYVFDYSLNIPFSKKLEEEFAILSQEGFIVEVDNGTKFELPAKKAGEGLHVIEEKQAIQLEKIASLDAKIAVNIAHLFYLKEITPEFENLKENKENFQKKARRTFFMNLVDFNDSFTCLNNLLLGGLSGV